MTACPACGRPVDPLRARAVGVRDGKVVGFCSAECARSIDSAPPFGGAARSGKPDLALESKPTAIPSGTTPSLDSGPVIEIVSEAKPRREATPIPMKPPPRDATPPPKKLPRAATPAAGTPIQKFPIPEPPPRTNRGLVIVFLLVACAGAAVAAYKFVL